MLKLPCFRPEDIELIPSSPPDQNIDEEMDAWVELLYEHAPRYVWYALTGNARILATKFLERVREKEA